MIGRRGLLWHCGTCLTVWLACSGAFSSDANLMQEPAGLIRSVSTAVRQRLDTTPASQALSTAEVVSIVYTLVMPNVETTRMTASAMGIHWRRATPAQQARLQEEFPRLVVHTYAGALSRFGNQTITVLPARVAPSAERAVVRTEVRGGGQPLRIDYRLMKTAEGWKIYDFSVMGVWLTLNYRSGFAHVIATDGIDGLISKLAEKNRANGG
jgi:phospholipid transport system substrate-binding protein